MAFGDMLKKLGSAAKIVGGALGRTAKAAGIAMMDAAAEKYQEWQKNPVRVFKREAKERNKEFKKANKALERQNKQMNKIVHSRQYKSLVQAQSRFVNNQATHRDNSAQIDRMRELLAITSSGMSVVPRGANFTNASATLRDNVWPVRSTLGAAAGTPGQSVRSSGPRKQRPAFS